MIAFVCAMPMELRPLQRRLRLRKIGLGYYAGRIGDRVVLAVATGIGTARANAATIRLLDTVDVEWVIVVGITGAIEDEIPIGTLVLPELVVNGANGSQYRPKPLRLGEAHGTMWTTDELLLDPAVHADLRARGVVSLDMETAAVAEVCDKRGVPWWWYVRLAIGPVAAVWTPKLSASATRTAGRTFRPSPATWSGTQVPCLAWSASPGGPSWRSSGRPTLPSGPSVDRRIAV